MFSVIETLDKKVVASMRKKRMKLQNRSLAIQQDTWTLKMERSKLRNGNILQRLKKYIGHFVHDLEKLYSGNSVISNNPYENIDNTPIRINVNPINPLNTPGSINKNAFLYRITIIIRSANNTK